MQQSSEAKENLWSGLLDSVSSGRRLPEKQVFVAGGTPELQKDFLETLESDAPKRPQDLRRKRPPVSNEFALGYTYQEVLDADHEDILARLSIYTLQEPLPAFVPLVKTLLTPQTVPATLVVILLDWTEPWNWIRQLRNWILFVQGLIAVVDEATVEAIRQNVQGVSPQVPPVASEEGSADADAANIVTQAVGEYDEALGLPICVVCHNSNKIEALEKEYSWREEEFDYLLQFLRTILLKYGASLIYTSATAPNTLPLLVQSSLDVHSSLKRETLKHNVVDRESILIPPNWDSWGKIRVIREGFDVEAISNSWSEAVQAAATARNTRKHQPTENGEEDQASKTVSEPLAKESNWTKVMQAFNEAIHDPTAETRNMNSAADQETQVKALNMQEFLAKQAEVMEQLRQEEEKQQASGDTRANGRANGSEDDAETMNRVNEHIGPVKFNMGGIQVDAEDMLNSLKSKDREETPGPEAEASASTPAGTAAATPDGGKQQNEALASFFAGLIKKGGTPKPGGK